MTVKELIERLSTLPQDAEALVLDDGVYQPIADIAEVPYVDGSIAVAIAAETID